MNKPALALLLVALSAVAWSAPADRSPLAQAHAALDAGEADQALNLLDPLAAQGSAEALNLRCRVYYSLENWDRAVSDCEQAVRREQGNSLFHMWLGRALGEKAGRASFMSAYSLGKRVHEEFETAVRLNGRNAEALSDLGEFDYSAPSMVGGGIDKAEAVASQLDHLEPARAHELRARIAEQRKDFSTAEREFKTALAADPHPAYQWITLASFYRRRSRWNEMDQAIHNGEAAAARDKHAAVALFDGASLLIKTNRDPAQAARMLAAYLGTPFKSESAPAFAAHTRLARLFDQAGDANGAHRELAAALAEAHAYRPALDLKLKH